MRHLPLVAVAVSAALAFSGPASATSPGANGRLAFVTGGYGVGDIAVMNADGSGRTVLTTGEMSGEPAWSPDGKRIAFQMVGAEAWSIFVMNADGSGRTQPAQTLGGSPAMTPAWSPDGKKILYDRDHTCCSARPTEIWVMNADGTGHVQLTTNGAPVETYPDWSPDGKRIVFDSGPVNTELPEGEPAREIYLMNPDGTGLTRLTTNTASDWGASWSPDGKRIAFVSARDGNFEVYVMNADGTGQTRLTFTTAADVRPVWSPDGTKIAFETDRDGNFDVYVMNADGSGQTNLTRSPGYDGQPDWQALPLSKTIRPGWTEKLVSRGTTLMVFKVSSIAIDGSNWSVTGSVTNRTARAIRIRKQFGLAVSGATLTASAYAPAVPARLGPGRTWAGTFSGSGSGSLPPGTIVRVVFATFTGRIVPGLGGAGVAYTTRHGARL